MARKRKRSGHSKVINWVDLDQPEISHAVLSQYYPRVSSLRSFIAALSSKSQKKKILSFGLRGGTNATGLTGSQADLVQLLDTTLVGSFDDCTVKSRELTAVYPLFSQQRIHCMGDGETTCSGSQSDLVDYAIWTLFHHRYQSFHRPPHLLCQGYQRTAQSECSKGGLPQIPGIISQYPNNHVSIIKGQLWKDLWAVMGPEKDQIMLNLILDCGIFTSVESGRGNLLQSSGVPIVDLQPLPFTRALEGLNGTKVKVESTPEERDLASYGMITFVKSRMLYARAFLKASGKIQLGLGHVHALNRYSNHKNPNHTLCLLMYMFPRQFGLHNVFTSRVYKTETMQQFMDYTLREREILLAKRDQKALPKRLRGLPFELIQKFQCLHQNLSYVRLLDHYCPVRQISPGGSSADLLCDPNKTFSSIQVNNDIDSSPERTDADPECHLMLETAKSQRPNLTVDHATPTANVSAFCRAVLLRLIPNQFWGSRGEEVTSNRDGVFQKVDRFIKLRRFENMTLHDVMEGLTIKSIPWLASPELFAAKDSPLSRTDLDKRRELLAEFVYYVFDSIIIPLIRSNFHVTESGSHRNRLFYFRQDVWRSLTDGHLKELCTNMFEELDPETSLTRLESRTLGYSRIRLRPKAVGVRPIMNLRRRPMVRLGGKRVLGQSVNSALANVHGILKYEKTAQPEKLKASMFSVGELYDRLKTFKSQLQEHGLEQWKLYFVKVDVRACFDSIPQRELVALMHNLLQEPEYSLEKHAEVKLSDARPYDANDLKSTRPSRRFNSIAKPTDDFTSFDQAVEQKYAIGKNNTVFVDGATRKISSRESIKKLLQEHVEQHTVKIGKSYYRQKKGIPQGSVLSTYLCNFFYGKLESERLGFLTGPGNLLLRLIDDFLFVTVDSHQARRFLQVMHDGFEEFGVEIDNKKSMVNFDAVVKGEKVATPLRDSFFPYCGNLIRTDTLEVVKDRDRLNDQGIKDSLTVDMVRVPGRSFYRKVLSSFKLQAQAMLLDTEYNTKQTVMGNLYEMFVETGMKFYCYMKFLPVAKQPSSTILVKTMKDLISLAQVLLQSKANKKASQDFRCSVSYVEVQWLAVTAFLFVLKRKQKKCFELITWLESVMSTLRLEPGVERVMSGVFKSGREAFRNVQY